MVDREEAERWGIQHRYTDALGRERWAPDHSVQAVLDQLRRGDAGGAPAAGIEFVPAGSTDLLPALHGLGLVLEDGTDLGPVEVLPPDLPIGYHRLVSGGDAGADSAVRLVVHPHRCFLPDDLRAWGWALQLHADRSVDSWGIGDLRDAALIGEWSKAVGGHPVLLLSPLHAPNLSDDPEPSPYFASSRCFRTPLALSLDRVAAAYGPSVRLDDLASAGRALNADRLIDRSKVWRLKREALERVWAAAAPDLRTSIERSFAADAVLRAFARFMVAVEQHGEGWAGWPAGLRHPAGPEWAVFEARHADRVAFHGWCQRLVSEQVSELNESVPVLHDLAVGTDRVGFDAWFWQDLFVLDGTSVGAPADEFNTLGQDWGLPPIDPWRLRAAGYEPFVRMLRCGFEAGAGLRLDHVMGLFRLFWIPPGVGAAEGVYVRQPADELLAIVALESVRAGAYVVGEDLGTVEPGVRERLADRRLMSYRVLALDDTPVEHYPVDSLASVTTHDLATIAGLWSGDDLADQERLGMEPPIEATHEQRRHFAWRVGVGEDAQVAEVAVAAHRHLSASASRIVLGQLEDAALVRERPNMPGVTEGWPSWSRALPDPLEVLLAEPVAGEVADALRDPPPGQGR